MSLILEVSTDILFTGNTIPAIKNSEYVGDIRRPGCRKQNRPCTLALMVGRTDFKLASGYGHGNIRIQSIRLPHHLSSHISLSLYMRLFLLLDNTRWKSVFRDSNPLDLSSNQPIFFWQEDLQWFFTFWYIIPRVLPVSVFCSVIAAY